MTFRTSVDDPNRMPPSHAEVAVIGRSNVGKSSLVNAVAGRRELARTSKTPGRTRLFNVFDIAAGQDAAGATLVDLPGYGYAKAAKTERDRWQERMEGYVLGREPLVMVIVLLDGAVGPTRLDTATVRWLSYHQVPFTVVATKQDKVRSSARARRHRELADGLGMDPDEVVWVSARTHEGIDRLRSLITAWVSAGPQ